MSGYGYAPPYHGGYPPQNYPPQYYPPQYAYVPTAVMMPAVPTYQPPPPPAPAPQLSTYVTNYIYQQPAGAVQVVDNAPALRPVLDDIDWIPCTSQTAHNLACNHPVIAGQEGWDSSPLWVIRAHHCGDLIPGKLAIKHRSGYVAYGGEEVPAHDFEVLCAPPHLVHWVSARNGNVPSGAIAAGKTRTGEKLYVGRARYKKSLTPGKVYPSHGCMYMSFGNKEVPHKQYEVLCKKLPAMSKHRRFF